MDATATFVPVEPAPPAELAWLTDLIGPEMALRLIEMYGGTRVYIPMSAGSHQKLARDLSPDAEAALVAALGGSHIRVPLAKVWRTLVYHARGEGVNAIARLLQIRDNTVSGYIAWGKRRGRGHPGWDGDAAVPPAAGCLAAPRRGEPL